MARSRATRMQAPTKATAILPQKPVSPSTSRLNTSPPMNAPDQADDVADHAVVPALLLQHSCAVDAVTGVRHSLETCCGNLCLTFLAQAEGIVFNALQSCGSFRQGVPLILQQCEGHLAIKSVRAQVSRVERQVGEATVTRPMEGFLS